MSGRPGLRHSWRDLPGLARALVEVRAQAPRKRRLLAQFDRSLPHQLVMAPGAGSGPGWVLQTPTPPLFVMGAGRHFLHHASVFVDELGAFMKVLCFGPPDRLGVPVAASDPARTATELAIADFVDAGCACDYSPLEPASVGGETAHEVAVRHDRLRITEWRFVHEDALFVVGVHLLPGSEEQEVLRDVRRVLATWQWFGRAAS